MEINQSIHGFRITRIRPFDELNAELVEMVHEGTGLELIWIKRDEENKTFGIAFETLPFDDTGVFHILEHSVLCGSDKYPVKEPFVNLLQTSMNTFLNALTFPDKTLYPISSRNDEDFFNLMSVYLDAVFRPDIYNKPEIFYQEGWHYELDENGGVSYKGVVFNEMKGVFASADELGEMALNRMLFPDSPYKFVSGGDPASIPELTYEKFIDSHRKFYSPSNAYVYFDGNVDIERALEYINSEYLEGCEKDERIKPPAFQAAINAGTREIQYELGEDEQEENKTRIIRASVIGSFDEREKIVGMQILSDVLCGSNQSVLTRAVLSEGLAEDVSMGLYDGVMQPWVKLEAQNIKDGKEEEIESLISDTLRALAENGIDRSQLEATMANVEFQMRERDFGTFPQGVAFSFLALESWLYGGDPMSNLVVGDLFDRLRAKMEEGFFEALIKDILLENQHCARVILKPSRTIGEERRAAEARKISAATAGWDDKARQEAEEKQRRLMQWQSSEDSEEALATLPVLAPESIEPKPERLPTQEGADSGIRTLYHDIGCSGIYNYTLYFDADDLTQEEISELSFLTDIMGKMRTSAHSEAELDRLGRLLFGNLEFSVFSSTVADIRDKCSIKLSLSFGTLEKNIEAALSLVSELLNDTQLDNEETALNLLKQLSTKQFQQIVMSGSSIGMGRIMAQSTSSGVANECAGGFEYYKWLRRTEENWCWKDLSSRLRALADRIISRDRLIISLTADNRSMLERAAEHFAGTLRSGEKCGESVIKPWGKTREGIVIPADISFACAGGVMPDFGEFSGSMSVTSRIIALAYLWNAVRVQGGAYGTGFAVNRNGVAMSYSYRDPNAQGTLKAYDGMADFVDEFCGDGSDISGFIIGAIASASPLLTPKAKGARADVNYFAGISDKDREKSLRQMLGTDAAELKATAEKIRKTYDAPGVCVLGGRNQLDALSLDSISVL